MCFHESEIPFIVKLVVDVQGAETEVVMTGTSIVTVSMLLPDGIKPAMYNTFMAALDAAKAFIPTIGWPIKAMSIEPAPAAFVKKS